MNVTLVAAFVLLFASLVRADAPAGEMPLSLQHAFELNEFAMYGGDTVVSRDNARVAYVACDSKRASLHDASSGGYLATADAPPYTAGCDVWVSAMDGSGSENITGAHGNSWSPAWSPDGAQLAFFSDRDGMPYLYVWDAATSGIRRVADAPVRSLIDAPQWLPDGEGIVVRLRPSGMSDAALGIELPRDSRAAASDVQRSTVVVQQSSEAARRNYAQLSTGHSSETQSMLTEHALDQPEPKGSISDIAIISASTGRVNRLVERAVTRVVVVSPEGKRLFYMQWKPGQPYGKLIERYDLIMIELASKARRVLASNLDMREPEAAVWSHDGRSIAYFSTRSADQTGSLNPGSESAFRADLFVVNALSGRQRRCLPMQAISGFDSENAAPVWAADGSGVYAIAVNAVWLWNLRESHCREFARDPQIKIRRIVTRPGRAAWNPGDSRLVVLAQEKATHQDAFYEVNLAGALRKRFGGEQRFRDATASEDGRRLIFKAQSASAAEDLWTASAAFDDARRVTTLNPQLSSYPFGRSRLIDFRSADGELLKASVLLPANYHPDRTYPTIVLVYAAGEGSKDANTFGLVNMGQYNYQLLATRGYLVLNPDIPVSVGTPMRDIMKAVMPAIDRGIHLGLADPDRLGVMGQSNGGNTTLSLLVQSQRFKAGIMNAGFGDLASLFGARNGGWHQWLLKSGGAMGVPPWENPLRYVENSPFFYLDRLVTPLMIQAGGEDQNIHPYSEQVFTALKYLHKDVTYLRYEDEGHVLLRSVNRVDYWNRVLPFLDRHVKGGRVQDKARDLPLTP